MEKVQFQLESTLPELKDLHEKGLFSKNEIDTITKRRTAFETSLVRLKTRKDDFFKYAEYEINLERLRKLRWKKCGYHLNPPGPSASTYSIPRRTLYILKRATAKFPGDLAVWLAYIEYAAYQGMTKVVAKGLNSALQHHPLSPTLYLLLAHHHLHPGDPLPRAAIPSSSALDLPSSKREEATPSSGFSLEGTGPARTTLLLGLRVLPRSHNLWREYVKLELGWVEGLRRRWRLLGLTEGKKQGPSDFDGDVDALVGGDGAFGPEGEDARRAILSGQLVVHALQSALDKVPPTDAGRDQSVDPTIADDGITFRDSLLELLRSYPSPLRAKALDVVYADLERVAAKGGEEGARARLALLTRPLYDKPYEPGVVDTGEFVLTGVDLVEALGTIGKEIRSVAKKAGPEWADVAGAWLAERINESGDNADLQRYLLSTLKALTKPSLKAPASLLLRHLELVQLLDRASYLSTARSHAGQYPSDPQLQLQRVEAEIASGDVDEARSACAAAAKAVTRPGLTPEEQDAVIQLWRAWGAFEAANGGEWKPLLRDSLRSSGVPELHPALLASYFETEVERGTDPKKVLDGVVASYHPTPAFFVPAFKALQDASRGSKDALTHMYRAWRAACRSDTDRVAAALSWARWLVQHGYGRDAHVAIETARRDVSDQAALDEGWTRLLDEAERARLGADDEDEDMESASKDESEGEESASDRESEAEQGQASESDDVSGDLEMVF